MAKNARKALRALANARDLDQEVFEELYGLATGSIIGAEHRALAIVGAAVLEDALRAAIVQHLNPRRTQESDVQLFEDEFAPLQSLAARTRLAFSLGIITEAIRSDLNDIRLIRVAFAHSPTRVDFTHKVVLQILDNLHTLNFYLGPAGHAELKTLAPSSYDPARFATAVSLLCGALGLGVPFWHPERSLARALKTAALHRPGSSRRMPSPP